MWLGQTSPPTGSSPGQDISLCQDPCYKRMPQSDCCFSEDVEILYCRYLTFALPGMALPCLGTSWQGTQHLEKGIVFSYINAEDLASPRMTAGFHNVSLYMANFPP